MIPVSSTSSSSSSSSAFVPSKFPTGSRIAKPNAPHAGKPSSFLHMYPGSTHAVLEDRTHVWHNLCEILKEYARCTAHFVSPTPPQDPSHKTHRAYRNLHTEFFNRTHFTLPQHLWATTAPTEDTTTSGGGTTTTTSSSGGVASHVWNIARTRVVPNVAYFQTNYTVILLSAFLAYICFVKYQPVLLVILLLAAVYHGVCFRLVFPSPAYTSVTVPLPFRHASMNCITITKSQFSIIGYVLFPLSLFYFTSGFLAISRDLLLITVIFILPHAVLYNPAHHLTSIDQAV